MGDPVHGTKGKEKEGKIGRGKGANRGEGGDY